MSDQYEVDDDDEVDLRDAELFDISDIVCKWGSSKSGREITMVMRSSSKKLCLMTMYLVLREEVQKMETEIGVLGETEGEH